MTPSTQHRMLFLKAKRHCEAAISTGPAPSAQTPSLPYRAVQRRHPRQRGVQGGQERLPHGGAEALVRLLSRGASHVPYLGMNDQQGVAVTGY